MGDFTGKMERLQALKSGMGIQYLLNAAREIIGNPIMTHDMVYKVIAYTEGVVTDDPIWVEYVANGIASHERLEFFKNECFLESAANAKKITFLLSDKLKYDRIFGKLFSGENIQIGAACIVETDRPFDDDDPVLFEFMCDVLNRELAQSEFYRDYGQAFQEILINKLIDGSIDDKEIYIAHVESIYIDLKDDLYLAVVDAPRSDLEPAQLRDLLKRTQPAFKYTVFAGRVAMILSSDSGALDAYKDLYALNALIEQHDLHVGISSRFGNLFDLQKCYTEAVSALNHGLKSDASQRIFPYKESRE